MSTAPIRSSRRTFLKQSAALTGAFALGIQSHSAMAAAGNAPEVTHWVVIQPDDTVIIRIARSELGQGSFTGLAQLVAVKLQRAEGNALAAASLVLKKARALHRRRRGGEPLQRLRGASALARHVEVAARDGEAHAVTVDDGVAV